MTYVYQGHIEKIPILEEILADAKSHSDSGLHRRRSDRVVDHEPCWFCRSPSRTRAEVKAKAHYITAAGAVEGAVREIAELLLMAQGHWPELLKKYEAE